MGMMLEKHFQLYMKLVKTFCYFVWQMKICVGLARLSLKLGIPYEFLSVSA